LTGCTIAGAPIVEEGRADAARRPKGRARVALANVGRTTSPIWSSLNFRQAQEVDLSGATALMTSSSSASGILAICSIFDQQCYNEVRTHLSLQKDAPIPRKARGIVACPANLGGLDHGNLGKRHVYGRTDDLNHKVFSLQN